MFSFFLRNIRIQTHVRKCFFLIISIFCSECEKGMCVRACVCVYPYPVAIYLSLCWLQEKDLLKVRRPEFMYSPASNLMSWIEQSNSLSIKWDSCVWHNYQGYYESKIKIISRAIFSKEILKMTTPKFKVVVMIEFQTCYRLADSKEDMTDEAILPT